MISLNRVVFSFKIYFSFSFYSNFNLEAAVVKTDEIKGFKQLFTPCIFLIGKKNLSKIINNNYRIAHQKNDIKKQQWPNFQLTAALLLEHFFFFFCLVNMLAVINRSILSCCSLSTRKWYIMKFLFLLLLYLNKFCEIFIINEIYFHFHFIKNFKYSWK